MELILNLLHFIMALLYNSYGETLDVRIVERCDQTVSHYTVLPLREWQGQEGEGKL